MTTANGKVNMNDPRARQLVYKMYRGMLGNYNNQANNVLQQTPSEALVVEDSGITKQLQSMASSLRRQNSQGSVSSSSGSRSIPSPQPYIPVMNGAGGECVGGGPPPPMGAPPPPPPPMPTGQLPAQRLASEIGPRKSIEPPSAIMNAMMTKDKKPFTYTPGGINLADIKSPRMARRVQMNAMNEGVAAAHEQPLRPKSMEVPPQSQGIPAPPPPPPPNHQPIPLAHILQQNPVSGGGGSPMGGIAAPMRHPVPPPVNTQVNHSPATSPLPPPPPTAFLNKTSPCPPSPVSPPPQVEQSPVSSPVPPPPPPMFQNKSSPVPESPVSPPTLQNRIPNGNLQNEPASFIQQSSSPTFDRPPPQFQSRNSPPASQQAHQHSIPSPPVNNSQIQHPQLRPVGLPVSYNQYQEDSPSSPALDTTPIHHLGLKPVSPPAETYAQPVILQQESRGGSLPDTPQDAYNGVESPIQVRVAPNENISVEVINQESPMQRTEPNRPRAQLGSLYIPPVETNDSQSPDSAPYEEDDTPPWRRPQHQRQQEQLQQQQQRQQQLQQQQQQQQRQQQLQQQQMWEEQQELERQQRLQQHQQQLQQQRLLQQQRQQQQSQQYRPEQLQPRIIPVFRDDGASPFSGNDDFFMQMRPPQMGRMMQDFPSMSFQQNSSSQPQQTEAPKERIIPIQIERDVSDSMKGMALNGRNDETHKPSQSRSFRILQMLTDTQDDDIDTDRCQDYRRLHLTEEDRHLMNMFRQQGASGNMSAPQGQRTATINVHMTGSQAPAKRDPLPEPKKYTGGYIPSRSFRILQNMTSDQNSADASSGSSPSRSPTGSPKPSRPCRVAGSRSHYSHSNEHPKPTKTYVPPIRPYAPGMSTGEKLDALSNELKETLNVHQYSGSNIPSKIFQNLRQEYPRADDSPDEGVHDMSRFSTSSYSSTVSDEGDNDKQKIERQESTRYLGAHIPSRVFKYLQEETTKYEEAPKDYSTYQETFQEPEYQDEPQLYAGSSFPSKTFRILQSNPETHPSVFSTRK